MIRIHFLNVGHGDCIIVEFTDTNRVAMIDINRSSDFDDKTKSELEKELFNLVDKNTQLLYQLNMISFSELAQKANFLSQVEDPIEYLKSKNINSIFRFISTHPHMDHLSGLNALSENIKIGNLWILKNKYQQELEKLSDEQVNDWKFYKKYRDTNEHKLDNITVVRPEEGDFNEFWKEDGIYILAPNKDLIDTAHSKNNMNIMSYVLLIKYYSHKIVLGGDAEEDTWKYIIDNYSSEIENVTILKASHHGRESGYFQPAVKIMNPDYTIVSVGKKPKTDASNKYRQYCDNVWSTRWKGNIIFELYSNGSGKYWTQFDR